MRREVMGASRNMGNLGEILGDTLSPLGYSGLEQAAQTVGPNTLEIVDNLTGKDPMQLDCTELGKDRRLQRFLPTYVIPVSTKPC